MIDSVPVDRGNDETAHPSIPTSRRSVVLKWLARISRFFLVALFIFTAGAKLAVIKAFAQNVSELVSAAGFNYRRWTWPATIAVIAVEVIVAALLLVPKSIRLGAVCAGLLLMFFAAFALYYVYGLKGEALECGCFGGIIASQLGVSTALRNLLLLIPAILVWFGYRKPRPTAR